MLRIKISYVLLIFFLICNCNPSLNNGANQRIQVTDIKLNTFKSFDKNIRYAIAGKNTENLILFIHGSPGSWEAYEDYLRDIDLQKYAILISVDRLGYGGSEKGIPEYSLESHAKYLSPILERYSNLNIILVGHSFGGPVAIQLAARYPKSIKKIILVAPSLDPDLEETLWYQTLGNTRIARFLLPSSIDISNQEILTLRAELVKQQHFFNEIDIPITHIHGTADSLVPFANTEYSKKQIKKTANLKIIRLEDANHFLIWNHFALIKEEILK